MSHRKVYSQGSIPFSWEDTPGVSRINHQDFPSDIGLHALNLVSSPQPPKPAPRDDSNGLHFPVQERKIPLPPCPLVSSPQPPKPAPRDDSNGLHFPVQERKIPLPPCPSSQPYTRRSASSKGLTGWWQEDPFVAAYKECTKNTRNVKSTCSDDQSKRSTVIVGSKTRKKKSKFIFSCKNSCDVRDDNLLMRLPNLPPLPKERIRTFR
ncbi:hypothetical protein EZV62_014535 [Acer yangbiense]|uniref:Uncharacterized protein n=1 Tax=Acer yangbiense TaxID=1000413 RepID=A0A5C7HUX1_9ROSI|nr:hypothetical protein EZV62_014535 [Acer yangbiense]